jgi:hypothetical protein
MSAAEIIAEIQKLPDAEMQQILDFVRVNSTLSGCSEDTKGHEADFQKSMDKVFRKHSDLFRRLAQ